MSMKKVFITSGPGYIDTDCIQGNNVLGLS